MQWFYSEIGTRSLFRQKVVVILLLLLNTEIECTKPPCEINLGNYLQAVSTQCGNNSPFQVEAKTSKNVNDTKHTSHSHAVQHER